MNLHLSPEQMTQIVLDGLRRNGYAKLEVSELEYSAGISACAKALRIYNADMTISRNRDSMLLHREEYVRSLFEGTDQEGGRIQKSRTSDDGWLFEVYAQSEEQD